MVGCRSPADAPARHHAALGNSLSHPLSARPLQPSEQRCFVATRLRALAYLCLSCAAWPRPARVGALSVITHIGCGGTFTCEFERHARDFAGLIYILAHSLRCACCSSSSRRRSSFCFPLPSLCLPDRPTGGTPPDLFQPCAANHKPNSALIRSAGFAV